MRLVAIEGLTAGTASADGGSSVPARGIDALELLGELQRACEEHARLAGARLTVHWRWPLPARIEGDGAQLRGHLLERLGNAIARSSESLRLVLWASPDLGLVIDLGAERIAVPLPADAHWVRTQPPTTRAPLDAAVRALAQSRLDALRADFLARLRTQAPCLRAEVESGERQLVAGRLHRIRGAAGMFGLQPLFVACAQAEQALASGYADAALERVLALLLEPQEP